jgi:hypothetical protein
MATVVPEGFILYRTEPLVFEYHVTTLCILRLEIVQSVLWHYCPSKTDLHNLVSISSTDLLLLKNERDGSTIAESRAPN